MATSNKDFLDAAATFSVTDEMTAEMGARYGVKRFKHHTQSTYYTKVLAAVTTAREAELRAEEQAAAEAAAKAEREARAAERADFDAWKAPIQSNPNHAEYRLLVGVNRAKAGLESWEKEKADFLERFMKTPSYALSWCGSTFEAAADRDICQWLVEGFELGCTVDVLAEEALRSCLRMAKSGNSRSTSTVSNLMDDAMCQAWAKAYERLSGKTFW